MSQARQPADRSPQPGAEALHAFQHVSRDGLVDALGRLSISSAPPDPRNARLFLDYARANHITLDHCWTIADSHRNPLHVVLIIPRPGRTGMVFLSPIRLRAEVRPLGALLRHAVVSIPPEQVHLFQALIDVTDDLHESTLSHAGFLRLADLQYLLCRVPHHPVTPEASSDITFHSYEAADRALWVELLEKTYEQSLDCPALQGMRDPRDVMTGHQSVGRFNPQLWTLLRVKDEPAGLLLLNPTPPAPVAELVYLGLSPEFRGQGLATLLLQRALSLCAQYECTSISLAVDSANKPAVRLYRAFHFKRTTTRRGLILCPEQHLD